MMAGANIIVRGVVQGVGYRWFVRREAARLELGGFCRNLSDGSVEIDVAGEHFRIEELVSRLRVGPSSAHVSDVAVVWKDPESFAGFEIW
jgi:acylphosphatase